MDRTWAEANETGESFSRQYLDTEDRVVLQDLPELDPSAGGVYFFGASNMKWALGTPDLPPEERKLVHNFAAGEGSPWFHLQFTDYLVREKHILRAGPEKTLIVFGTSFLNAVPASDGTAIFFPNLWRRYGLYRYDFNSPEGIEPASWGRAWDAYALEKARCSSLVQGLIDHGGRLAVPRALRRRMTQRDPAGMAAYYKQRMGVKDELRADELQQWQKNIPQHRRELQQWLDYLRARKMEFKIVLLPLATWHDPLPYPPAYRTMLKEFCNANKKDVELIELDRDVHGQPVHLLADDEFFDHIHPNPKGLKKTTSALMDIANKFLKRPAEERLTGRNASP
jgi:hypothetical protein